MAIPWQNVTQKKDCCTVLPAELKEQILSQLPIKDIWRARAVSKHFKSFIDCNISAILRPSISYHRSRILAGHRALLQTSKLKFDDALWGCIEHYGWIPDVAARKDITSRFLSHYVNTKYHALPDSIRMEVNGILLTVTCAVYCREDAPIVRGTNTNYSFSMTVLDHDQFFGDVALQSGDDTLAGGFKSWRFLNRAQVPKIEGRHEFPRFFITRTADSIYVPEVTKWSRFYSLHARIVTRLGLQAIPPDKPFAYCVKSHKMWALTGQIWSRPGKWMTEFEKASLLEDIFIW